MQYFLASIAMALAVSGCAVASLPSRLLAPANPQASVPPLRAPDASAGTLTFRPVGPMEGRGSWGQPQSDVAPKIKGAKP